MSHGAWHPAVTYWAAVINMVSAVREAIQQKSGLVMEFFRKGFDPIEPLFIYKADL